jgi:ribosomal protein S18 acetylase RimI-like enzyme
MDPSTALAPTQATIDAIFVRRAFRPADWRAARRLLDEYLDWLQGHEHLARTDRAYQNQADRLRPEVTFSTPHRLFLASRGANRDDSVGCVGVRVASSTAELTRLYVTPDARGLGAARALVRTAISDAATRRFGLLRLNTHPPTMPDAYALYRKLGFVVTGTQAGVSGGVSMELALPAVNRG